MGSRLDKIDVTFLGIARQVVRLIERPGIDRKLRSNFLLRRAGQRIAWLQYDTVRWRS